MNKAAFGTITAAVFAGVTIFGFGILSTANDNNTAQAKPGIEQQQPLETKQPVENNSESEAFRNIKTVKQKLQFQIKGEASVFEGTYHYSIKQGDKVIAADFGSASLGGPAWGKIDQKIDVPVNKLSSNAPLTIEIYEIDQESGKQVNKVSMPLFVNTNSKAKNNDQFRNISITPITLSYSLKGEARMHEGTYHYAVKQGNNIIVSDYGTTSIGAPDWGKIEQTITIPANKLAAGPLVLELFSMDEESGKAVNIQPFQLLG